MFSSVATGPPAHHHSHIRFITFFSPPSFTIRSPRSLSPRAALPHPSRTPPLSVPVEGCERLPGLPGVRKVGPDSLTRRCSDQGCNFGTRAGLNSAAITALRALDTADTGSPFSKKPGVRNIRRKVRPDIATFARSRQSDLDCAVNFYRDVFECHVALHESEAAFS